MWRITSTLLELLYEKKKLLLIFFHHLNIFLQKLFVEYVQKYIQRRCEYLSFLLQRLLTIGVAKIYTFDFFCLIWNRERKGKKKTEKYLSYRSDDFEGKKIRAILRWNDEKEKHFNNIIPSAVKDRNLVLFIFFFVFSLVNVCCWCEINEKIYTKKEHRWYFSYFVFFFFYFVMKNEFLPQILVL